MCNIFHFYSFKLGYVRDKTNYVTTLHFLNLCTYFVTICWLAERFYRNYQERNRKVTETDSFSPSAKWILFHHFVKLIFNHFRKLIKFFIIENHSIPFKQTKYIDIYKSIKHTNAFSNRTNSSILIVYLRIIYFISSQNNEFQYY